MPEFRTSRLVGHSPERMFALVADVGQYPQFLPLCEDISIRRHERREDGTELLVARMRVGYKAISETFTSRVTLDHAHMTILVEYVDGPFRHLENRWNFTPCVHGENPEGCEVGFYITYEFASRTLGLLMGVMFDRAFRKFAEAFEARADAVHGTGTRLTVS